MSKKAKVEEPKRVKGTIEKHGKFFRARWMVDGKLYLRSTGTDDPEKAAQKLDEFLEPFRLRDKANALAVVRAQMEAVAEEIKEVEAPALSMAEAWQAYIDSAERPDSGEATLKGYKSQYEAFVKWLAAKHPPITALREVTTKIVNEYFNEFEASHAPKTYNNLVKFFRMFWRVLAKEIHATENPFAAIRMRTVAKEGVRRELTVEELQRVCNFVRGEMRTLFALGIYTGQRLADCVLLQWGNVDLVRGVLHVTPRKTMRRVGVELRIPIHAALASVLKETPSIQRHGYVVPELAALYLKYRSALSKRIQWVFRDCGIVTHRKSAEDKAAGRNAICEVGFHSLRHTFVSMAANAGAPLEIIGSIVGHTSPAMTRHYHHVSQDALLGAVRAIPEVGTANLPPAAPNALEGVKSAFLAMSEAERKAFLEWAAKQA